METNVNVILMAFCLLMAVASMIVWISPRACRQLAWLLFRRADSIDAASTARAKVSADYGSTISRGGGLKLTPEAVRETLARLTGSQDPEPGKLQTVADSTSPISDGVLHVVYGEPPAARRARKATGK
jgi:hypothetical protein